MTILCIVAGVLFAVITLFALASCKVAGKADRLDEEMRMKEEIARYLEQKEQDNEDLDEDTDEYN